jgi:phosphopantetheine adenylyltransferase
MIFSLVFVLLLIWPFKHHQTFGPVDLNRSVLDTQYEYRMSKLNMQLNASLTTMVYCKVILCYDYHFCTFSTYA